MPADPRESEKPVTVGEYMDDRGRPVPADHEQAQKRLADIKTAFAHGHGQVWETTDVEMFDALVAAVSAAEGRAATAETERDAARAALEALR